METYYSDDLLRFRFSTRLNTVMRTAFRRGWLVTDMDLWYARLSIDTYKD